MDDDCRRNCNRLTGRSAVTVHMRAAVTAQAVIEVGA